MKKADPAPRHRARIALALLSIVVPLALFEIALRAIRPKSQPQPPPTAIFCGGCPHIYELNPEHANISSQRLRDRDFTVPKPEGVYRILVLGDSLVYGTHVTPDKTFPKVLEKIFDEKYGKGKLEVLNTGVPGYTPYNEWQYYIEKGRAFAPDLVLVSFCLNDVVDPIPHWGTLVKGRFEVKRVPDEAIPNISYHWEHTVPRLEARRREVERSRTLRKSEIYRRVLEPLVQHREPTTSVTAGGRTFPAYVTGEDSLSIEVLTRYDSPEWVWLRTMYDKLYQSVSEESHAKFAILINPLSYQLDPAYPLSPQELFSRYCIERAFFCLDVLPALRKRAAEKPFYGTFDRVVDIWHYTPEGHRIVADELATFLEQQKLLPAEDGS